MNLGRAISMAAQAFEKIEDKSGEPYMLHCLAVMHDVKHKREAYKIVAVLHDLVEDTDWTLEDVRNQGFTGEVITALDCMTHRDGIIHPDKETYDQYLTRIAENKIATRVKLGDLKHNTNILRLKGVREKDHIRIAKYHKAFMRLSKVYGEMKGEDK